MKHDFISHIKLRFKNTTICFMFYLRSCALFGFQGDDGEGWISLETDGVEGFNVLRGHLVL